MGEAFRARSTAGVRRAGRFFDIVITDSGTGWCTPHARHPRARRPAHRGGLTDRGRSERASKTLDWLLAHGHERLVEDAGLVLCRPEQPPGRSRPATRHVTERCKHVVEIPADRTCTPAA